MDRVFMYTIEMNQDFIKDQDLLKAVLNDYRIDTSASFDSMGEINILDAEEGQVSNE